MKSIFGKKRGRQVDEQLDQLGRQIVRASAGNEAEAEAVGASPFLYTRLRARISAERVRRSERESWLTLLGVAWRTVPAMMLVAVFAVALFLSASFGTGTSGSSGDYSLTGHSDGGIENVVFAEQRTLSTDDALATIWDDEDERETTK